MSLTQWHIGKTRSGLQLYVHQNLTQLIILVVLFNIFGTSESITRSLLEAFDTRASSSNIFTQLQKSGDVSSTRVR